MLLYLHSQKQINTAFGATKKCRLDSVAQLVEHYTFNVGVLGSNPSGITPSDSFKHESSQINDLRAFCFKGDSYGIIKCQISLLYFLTVVTKFHQNSKNSRNGRIQTCKIQ